jgi:hypothetical protein
MSNQGPFIGVIPFSAIAAMDDTAGFHTAEYLHDNVVHPEPMVTPADIRQCQPAEAATHYGMEEKPSRWIPGPVQLVGIVLMACFAGVFSLPFLR